MSLESALEPTPNSEQQEDVPRSVQFDPTVPADEVAGTIIVDNGIRVVGPDLSRWERIKKVLVSGVGFFSDSYDIVSAYMTRRCTTTKKARFCIDFPLSCLLFFSRQSLLLVTIISETIVALVLVGI
jgi:hypothetical protein